jgi:site-specific recombinase XerD
MRATNESITIAKHINKFLNEYAPSRATQSEHTLKSYGEALSLYIGFLETEKGVNSNTLRKECFCAENVESWLVWLMKERSCSPRTCNTRLASLRAFSNYLGEKDISFLHIAQSLSQIKRCKTAARKVVGMSKQAILALVSAPDSTTKTGRRDIALMVTMYSTAARIDEVLSLQVKQLHLDNVKPYVTVIGKGGRIRTLYLLPKAVSHLKAYLQDAHGETPNPESYVFYSRIKGTSGKMSQKAVNKQLRKHAIAAKVNCKDVPIDVHAHQFRHAKASHWLEDGMNIVQISFLLGHAQLETTMVYLDITTEQEAQALATLGDENEKSLPKKWKEGQSLASLCGVRPLRQ